jgi:transposase
VQSARDHDVSWPVVSAAFTAHAMTVLPDQPRPVRVLGIDEVRRGRLKWEFDEVTQPWQTVVDRWHVGLCATRRCLSGWRCETAISSLS